MCEAQLCRSGSVGPVLSDVSAGFTVCASSLRASPPRERVCDCVSACVSVYVCQLERSWRTGVLLPRQHFLVINDSFLPRSLIVWMEEIDDI